MKKHLIIILCFLFLNKANAQLVYSYTPDSATLSILLDSTGKLNFKNATYSLSIKNKWHYKLKDSASIYIRGSVATLNANSSLNCVFTLFGKKYSTKLKDGVFTFNKSVPISKILKKPKIMCFFPNMPQQAKAWIDSIDITAIR